MTLFNYKGKNKKRNRGIFSKSTTANSKTLQAKEDL